MLTRLKAALFPGKKLSSIERIKQYDLAEKPFAYALLHRAAASVDEHGREARKITGCTLPYRTPASLEEEASSAAVIIAHHVTFMAMKNIGRNPVFWPGDPLPKDGPMVIAFSLFALTLIHGNLKSEEIHIDFMKAGTNTACLFFLVHPEEERIRFAMQGIEAFRAAALSGHPKVEEWQVTLSSLVQNYVLSYSVTDERVQNCDWNGLFGKMLSSLLACVE
jgi:hypothetical protein